MILLSRDHFREGVFLRDNHQCVVCRKPAVDAHHLLERRLWGASGGYFLDNGVSVCEPHHLEAEMTILSCEKLRELAGIKTILLPDQLYPDTVYTKWGDVVLENGTRLKGELFFDESVQKILGAGKVLDLYSKYIKYPRSFHLPWSQSVNSDDRVVENLDGFVGKEVVVTIKQDGECTTLYSDYMHARSVNSNNHVSRNWAKSFHSQFAHNIPEDWRVCAENLYAKHSIEYKNLESWLQVFSVWNERNFCVSWDETVEWTQLLGLVTVPVIYRGIWDEKHIRGLYNPIFNGDACEGYVVRTANGFKYGDFRKCLAKFVRAGHVQTHGHWQRSKLVVNGLKES